MRFRTFVWGIIAGIIMMCIAFIGVIEISEVRFIAVNTWNLKAVQNCITIATQGRPI